MTRVLVDVLQGKPSPHTPIWLMRQAGRYLPEYRKLRMQVGGFLELCKTPEMAAEVTLQPLRRFDLDAAIVFSDILVIPDALGLDLYFAEGEGPNFNNPIRDEYDVNNLLDIDVQDSLQYVFDTLKLVRAELSPEKTLIGFSGSPFTLACYMLEGKSSRNYEIVKHWLYQKPEVLDILLTKLSDIITKYLSAQIIAGADVVQIFDSWGGILTPDAYVKYSFKYLQLIVDQLKMLHPNTPVICFTKGCAPYLDLYNELNCSAIGLDWTVSLSQARKQVTNKVLQGNLDPVILSAITSHSKLRNEIARIVNDYKDSNNGSLDGWVFNLGHGILPSANIDNVEYLVNTVHEITSR